VRQEVGTEQVGSESQHISAPPLGVVKDDVASVEVSLGVVVERGCRQTPSSRCHYGGASPAVSA
jgi:hypothetical protein